ncbi:EpsG family protein [Gallibacterium anatis]|uniref:EpsG family protein n=1 Tax=Gallibacterium anatis TaxID=750 RepID=A0A930UUW3_9PAST|nr:EpsG family protein [Gallibacterium anatis]
MSTRYGIGPDYFLYERLYSEAKSVYYFNWDYYLNNKYNIEIGYLFFESLVKVFTDDFSCFYLYNIVLFFILFLGILNTKIIISNCLYFYTISYLLYKWTASSNGYSYIFI